MLGDEATHAIAVVDISEGQNPVFVPSKVWNMGAVTTGGVGICLIDLSNLRFAPGRTHVDVKPHFGGLSAEIRGTLLSESQLEVRTYVGGGLTTFGFSVDLTKIPDDALP